MSKTGSFRAATAGAAWAAVGLAVALTGAGRAADTGFEQFLPGGTGGVAAPPAVSVPVEEAGATTAELWLDQDAARPGTTVWAGVHLKMKSGWHTYWRNPGESGMATEIEWQLPPGLRADPVQWPPPERHVAGGIATYVFHDETVLLVPLRIAPDTPPGEVELKAAVSWLECQEACVPGGGDVSARLTIGDVSRPSSRAEALAQWRARVPQPDPSLEVSAKWEGDLAQDKAVLVLAGPATADFAPNDFFSYGADDYEINAAPAETAGADGRFSLRKQALRFGDAWPVRLAGLLVQTDDQGRVTRAREVTFAVAGAGPGAGPAPAAPAAATNGTGAGEDTAASAALQQAVARNHSLLGILLLAFLGGLILNVMPCVLPVIALKILGFVQQSQEAPGRVRRLGLTYGAGVLASFLTMAAVVIGVQQAGGGASWGMQMQNPYFRLALLVVVVLVALNLFGVFEITLGGTAMGAASKLASREGYPGAFFNGILATALGTSCTAPFLAVAVGFAFTQSAAVVGLLFLTIGAGLAFPYVLLSWNPGWLKFLPKPGAWMQRFKVAMGFPMLGTAVWMFEFTAPAYGTGGVLWLGMFLVALGVIAWIWGEFGQRGARRRGLARGIALLLALGAYVFILEGQLHWRHPVGRATTAGVVKDSPDGLAWRPWSPAAVEAARQEGHLVLVDFTAKWCPNCRSNKKFAIDIPAVRQKLADLKGVVFRADYTDYDPRITEALKQHERAGVPLVLVYPADPARPPIVLPPLLTPGIVIEALDRAAGRAG